MRGPSSTAQATATARERGPGAAQGQLPHPPDPSAELCHLLGEELLGSRGTCLEDLPSGNPGAALCLSRQVQHLVCDSLRIPNVCCRSVAQSCLTLCNPMDCSPPGSSVHGVSQERILEWVAISSSRVSSWPRDRTHISFIASSLLHWQVDSLPLSHQRRPSKCLLEPKQNPQDGFYSWRPSGAGLYPGNKRPSKSFLVKLRPDEHLEPSV